jgi:hypothetical protein
MITEDYAHRRRNAHRGANFGVQGGAVRSSAADANRFRPKAAGENLL